MKKTLFLLTLSFFINTASFSQNALIGDGFSSGWDVNSNLYNFSLSLGNSRIATVQANGTGNQYFRFVKNWNSDLTQYAPAGCADANMTFDSGVQYDNMPSCGSGVFYITVDNTSHNYVFKTPGLHDNDFVYFRIDGAIGSVNTVSQSPTTVNAGVSVAITANTGTSLSAGQGVFLRYTTDAYTTSTVVKMVNGFGPIYTSSIPGFPEGEEVSYYIFISGDIVSIPASNADWFTINLNNNGGSNYSYIVGTALPVELSEFFAEKKKSTIELNWTTKQEINNEYFLIERSNEENNTWEEVGRIAGNGNSETSIDYTFIDQKPSIGSNYYRLKQINFDGKFEYSLTILVVFEQRVEVLLYPNPSSDFLNISFNSDFSNAKIRLFDRSGKIIVEEKILENETRIDLRGLSDSIYFLSVLDRNGNTLLNKKFLKVRE